jgi:hypothetical protein
LPFNKEAIMATTSFVQQNAQIIRTTPLIVARAHIAALLGIHAVTLLKLANGLNPLAATAGFATCVAVGAAMTLTCRKITDSIHIASTVGHFFGIVAGALVYTAASTLTTTQSIALNGSLFGLSILSAIALTKFLPANRPRIA